MMKPFEDLTDDELRALDEDAVTFYIDLECAEQGLALLPPQAPKAPTKEQPPHDLQVFFIGTNNNYSSDFITLDQDHARRVVEAMNSAPAISLLYMPGASLEKKATRRTEPFAVNSMGVYSEAMVDRVGAELTRFAEDKAKFEKDRAAYDKTVRARAEIAQGIHDRVDEAWQRHHRQVDLRTKFERYLELANGSREVAARFLARAESDAPAVLPDIFEGVTIDPPKAGPVEVASDAEIHF